MQSVKVLIHPTGWPLKVICDETGEQLKCRNIKVMFDADFRVVLRADFDVSEFVITDDVKTSVRICGPSSS